MKDSMASAVNSEAKKGFWYVVSCYLIWGTFPLYWYPLNGAAINAEQIMAQRVLWSAVFSVLLLLCFKKTGAVLHVFRQPKKLLLFVLSAFLIGSNWLVYLWAINNHHILDASLGYFINPLLNVLLGCVFLREKLNVWQVLAVVLALTGILWLALPAGQIPWVALLIALSFGFYGLVRKLVAIDVLAGIALETLIMLPIALIYLAYCHLQGVLVFGELSALCIGILLCSGAATTLPLLLFTAGARRISLSLLGILQYLSPSLQLMWGLMLFNETLNSDRLIGYLWVWLAVVVFLLGAWLNSRRVQAA